MKFAHALLLALSLPVYAAQPVPGTYIGGLFGGTYQFNNSLNTYVPFTRQAEKSGIGHDVLIEAGAQVGYRFCDNFRAELQLLYNKNPYSYVRINRVTFHNHTTSGTGVTINGSATEGLGFVNLFYDHLGDPENRVVPYLGVGIGYAYIYNVNSFYNDKVYIQNSRKTSTKSSPAAQGIIGISRYLDDFMSFGLDVRYTASSVHKYTAITGQTFNSSFRLVSFNLLFNGAFDFA